MKKQLLFLLIVLFFNIVKASNDPHYIKSVAFTKGGEALIPFFKLNEGLQFSFDDLNAVDSDYYYKIVHCNRDWSPSNLRVTEYLQGMNDLRIRDFKYSFNTLQNYVHYTISLPNSDTRILISGNYKIEIYNDSQEKVIERRFVIYEDLVSVGVEAKKMRDLSLASSKQNLHITIDFGNTTILNPKKNLNIVLLQNGQWSTAKTNITPQYTLGTQFKYQYDSETSFWGGNEFLYFDNSDLRAINNNVEKIVRDDVYLVHLRPKIPSGNQNFYTYYQDVNGSFKPRNSIRANADIEADYAWVYFTYKLNKLPANQKLFIVGMFNNYQLQDSYEVIFDSEQKLYTTALMLKQGFTNYKYVIAKTDGTILEELNPEGNFFETQNQYDVLVYYKNDADRFERVIGLGSTNSNLITN